MATYNCAACSTVHTWGREQDGYHHQEFDAQGKAPMDSEEMVVRGDLMVAFGNIGEGWSGDYDEDDVEDENLLRLYVYMRDTQGRDLPWKEVDEGSICTALPANTPASVRKGILEVVLNEAEASVDREARSVSRHLMDEFSYINAEWPEKGALLAGGLPALGPS